MDYEIRPLSPAEFELCDPLAVLFHAEHPMPDGWDLPTFVSTWSHLYQQGMALIVGAWKAEQLVGVLGVVLLPSLNSGQIFGSEGFWFLHPKHRGRGALAGKLLDAVEDWCWRQGCRRIYMYGLATSKTTVGAFLRRRGYGPVQTTFHMERPATAAEAAPEDDGLGSVDDYLAEQGKAS